MSARISLLALFIWVCFVTFILPYTEGAQGLWLLLNTAVLGGYTGLKVTEVVEKGGEL